MFKNLNQFKKGIKVGQKVKVKNMLKNVTENRVVTKVQTNGISTGTEISYEEYLEKKRNWMTENHVKEIDGKYFMNIRLEYQKAKNMNFDDNTVQFLAHESKLSHGGNVLVPSPDFEVGQPWLELEVIN